MEREYPIWSVSATWDNASYPSNCSSFVVSFRRDLTERSVQKWAERWFVNMIQRKYPEEKIKATKIEVKFLGKDTWYGSWFSHTSLNRFNNEAEAFASFRKYLLTVKEKGERYSVSFVTKNGQEYCPMGADDYWRWKYCECRHCKRRNQTIITH